MINKVLLFIFLFFTIRKIIIRILSKKLLKELENIKSWKNEIKNSFLFCRENPPNLNINIRYKFSPYEFVYIYFSLQNKYKILSVVCFIVSNFKASKNLL